MKFSIITPTYKRPEPLARAVKSVIDQTTATWEMIVVNDNPNDGTGAIIAQLADPRIKFLENKKNEGVNFSRNNGLDHIEPDSDWVIFLDDDDCLTKDALATFTDIFNRTRAEWIMTARGISASEPTTTAPGSKMTYSYIWDYLIRRRLQGDATHCINTALIHGPQANIRFPSQIRQAEEWLFYCELDRYTAPYFENIVTTTTDGYAVGGLNLRKRGFSEQMSTIPKIIKEARGRDLYSSPAFWIYVIMRIIRAFIK